MKRLAIVLLAVVLSIAPAVADYPDPEPWSGSTYTRQEWGFPTGAGLGVPQSPDVYTNPYGEPTATVSGQAFWIDDPSVYVPTDRRGVWVVGDFVEPRQAELELSIPDAAVLPEKLVWLRVTYLLVGEPGFTYDTELACSNPSAVIDKLYEQSRPVPDDPDWNYYEVMWRIRPQPGQETIATTITVPGGALLAMDDVRADTVCLPESRIIYVDDDAPGFNVGTSWDTAFKYLQDALAVAAAGAADEIRIAQGTYLPDEDLANPDGTGDRTATFQLVSGVAIYGGYAGLGATNPDARDIEQYETVLSGDLAGNDGPNFANNDENSYHVVTGSNTDATATLDGFTITAGNADGSSADRNGGGVYCYDDGSATISHCTISGNWAVRNGGGVYCKYNSSPTITYCVISGNSAVEGGYGEGGGIYCESSSPTITNCTISGNSAGNKGGGVSCKQNASARIANCVMSANSHSGLYCYYSSPTVVNCTIGGNSAYQGGGIRCEWSHPIVTNCTISGNSAQAGGGGVHCFSSNPRITNSILWGDNPDEIGTYSSTPVVTYSCIEGCGTYCSAPDDHNIGDDPLFADADGRLSPGSPCIDAGDDNAIFRPAAYADLDGNYRIINCTVDMGAYEFIRYRFDPLEEPMLCGAIVRKTHGDAGELDVHLPLPGGTECRSGALRNVILLFSEPVQANDGSLDINDEVTLATTPPGGTITGLSIAGNGLELHVDITGVVDEWCVGLTVETGTEGITDLDGNQLTGDNEVYIQVLEGNTNGDDHTDLIDMAQVKSKNGSPVAGADVRFDVNLDGRIDLIDMALVKSRNGGSATCP